MVNGTTNFQNFKLRKNCYKYQNASPSLTPSMRLIIGYIINGILHLFTYINDSGIAKSSNEREGYFTHLEGKLTLHKGLRFDKRKNLIKWYLFLKNQKG